LDNTDLCQWLFVLQGHIGQTSPTPREMALDDYVARRHSSGFVAPSYTFDTVVTDDGRATTDLKESAGRDELMSRLSDKVTQYDDRTFKYWCYDTPGLVNPSQVSCCCYYYYYYYYCSQFLFNLPSVRR